MPPSAHCSLPLSLSFPLSLSLSHSLLSAPTRCVPPFRWHSSLSVCVVHLKCFICILMRMRRKVLRASSPDVRSAYLHAILSPVLALVLALALAPAKSCPGPRLCWLTSLGSRQFMRPGPRPQAPRQSLDSQLERPVPTGLRLRYQVRYRYVATYVLVPCACHQVGLKWQSRFNGRGQGQVTN